MTTRTYATRASSYLHRSPRVRLAGLLSVPMVWLLLAYLGSLAVMFAAAFWTTDSFTGVLIHSFTWDNFHTLVDQPVYRRVALRTLGIAVAVTVIDAIIALPMAFYMAKVASPRWRRLLVASILTPLWASYLVKAYAWRAMLANGGVLDWALKPIGLHGPGFGLVAVTMTLAYLWLPFMILPVYAGFERLPDSLLEASADLGAPAGRTFRSVALPAVFPALVAGSIFTFSLTLGDYITVKIVGGKTQMFANVIYDSIGVAANLPFAAAAATVPVLLIVVYLTIVRRTGALENL
ncbi:MAG: putative spermidine/putrescine transport system permease protein [Frankiales bacterium]|jgi:putative spermidine/putrescine transport system permease protein|nr:putative spermidine/putrescine transport system permease protein [Frankiales bacterium]